ncbi:hypothetical protein EDEG_02424 [Edhazardia aedis USNM 41457]|uniref:Uncharacterized protein n=1 Tax=Edhazardia aedis (strain USNM 41457) TaxID=1003232 RepID=J9D6R4_EDHAE|nr:hypothetical protein EDEG_02424 [Edhazardia aedis USNM 41457]|eukprot:EJW03209.1 hypothetical protein EDEG_02424 [Edhazardia aedis USNM 41457]
MILPYLFIYFNTNNITITINPSIIIIIIHNTICLLKIFVHLYFIFFKYFLFQIELIIFLIYKKTLKILISIFLLIINYCPITKVIQYLYIKKIHFYTPRSK